MTSNPKDIIIVLYLQPIVESPTIKMSTDPTQNVTNGAIGNPLSTENRVLDTGAALAQVSLFGALIAMHNHSRRSSSFPVL